MSGWKEYIAYLKDNPEGYWFKRKAFGWGWTPVTREGWLITLLYGAALLLIFKDVDEQTSIDRVIIPFATVTLLLIITAYRKGEPPRWNWGFPKKEDTNDPTKSIR